MKSVKITFATLLLVFVTSQKTFSNEKFQGFKIITHQQFLNLTYTEQKSYIKEFQNIIAEMDSSSDYFGSNFEELNSKWAIIFKANMSDVHAGRSQESAKNGIFSSINDLTDQIADYQQKSTPTQLEQMIEAWKRTSAEYASSKHRLNIGDRSDIEERLAVFKTMIGYELTKNENSALKVKHQTQFPNSGGIGDLSTTATTTPVTAPAIEERSIPALPEVKKEPNKNAPPPEKSVASTSKTEKKPEIIIPSQVNDEKTASPNSAVRTQPQTQSQPLPLAEQKNGQNEIKWSTKNITLEECNTSKKTNFINDCRDLAIKKQIYEKLKVYTDGYRCMNSGFIIKQSPCRAPQSLADFYNISIFKDYPGMNCKDGQQICNPLIFGFKTDKCPFNLYNKFDSKCFKNTKSGDLLHCIKNGPDATKRCSDLSKDDASLESAVALIKNNPSLWYQYVFEFNQLCNEDKINRTLFVRNGKMSEKALQRSANDIDKTCSVANKRLGLLAQKYNIDVDPAYKPPTGSAQKGTK